MGLRRALRRQASVLGGSQEGEAPLAQLFGDHLRASPFNKLRHQARKADWPADASCLRLLRRLEESEIVWKSVRSSLRGISGFVIIEGDPRAGLTLF